MSTELIIAIIIVVVLVLIALLVMLPRMRAAASRKQAQRELQSRRETVADQHRAEAAEREKRAEVAEQKVRIAQQDAERERAEAKLRHEQAAMHDRGLADDELIDESERDRFADVTGPSADLDRDGSTMDDRARAASGGAPGIGATGAGAGTAGTTVPDADRTAGTPRAAEGSAEATAAGAGTPADETAEQGMSDYQRGREDERRERLPDDLRESDRDREG
jgi:type II secretory pathway pseudopilin PulG